MTINFGPLESSIQEKVTGDVDFIASIDSLSDDEKNEAIANKKQEVYEEMVSDLQTRAKEADEAKTVAENQKKRAEKAEAKLPNKGRSAEGAGDGDGSSKNDGDISFKDSLALINAGVTHEEDVDEVAAYASFKKISIPEALKNAVVKTTLAQNAEFRKTQQAMHDGNGKRGSTPKVSDDTLLDDLSEGKVPKKGSDEAERLFWARRGGKKQ